MKRVILPVIDVKPDSEDELNDILETDEVAEVNWDLVPSGDEMRAILDKKDKEKEKEEELDAFQKWLEEN